jgi:glycosyltransferase involved in cell wall biosynthesis
MNLNQPYPHRVLHIIRSQSLGGSILSSLRQAQAEKSLGRQVEVWVWLQKQKQKFDELTTKYDFPIKRVTAFELGLGLLGSHFDRPPTEIVHLQSGIARVSPNLGLLRRLIPARTSLVVTLRGPSQFEPHTEPTWRERQLSCSRFVSAIIVPSEMERQVQIDAGIPAEKVFAVPNIMEPKPIQSGSLRRRLSLPPDVPVILFCGRMTVRKSPLQTIEAFRYVVAQYPNAVLVMAGEGDLLVKCQEKAKDLGNSVHFLGHVNDVDSLYVDADIFVGPSTAESFGRTAMEAALTKTPMVLGCIRPWTDYFVPSHDCEFVDPQNPQSIAQGILRLLDDKLRANQFSENAFQVVTARFSQSAALEALSKAYEYALST